jgi:hypothetical protein
MSKVLSSLEQKSLLAHLVEVVDRVVDDIGERVDMDDDLVVQVDTVEAQVGEGIVVEDLVVLLVEAIEEDLLQNEAHLDDIAVDLVAEARVVDDTVAHPEVGLAAATRKIAPLARASEDIATIVIGMVDLVVKHNKKEAKASFFDLILSHMRLKFE